MSRSTTDAALVRDRLAALLDHKPPAATGTVDFLESQFDMGLAAVDFPPGAGGLGVAPALQDVVTATLYEAGAPSGYFRNPIGVGHGAPTIVEHGTQEQIERFLRPMFSSREIWCQLFSEPDAGSDLAGLATRAEPEGDEWVVDGVKCWTSLARVSRWGMLLARTDGTVPKHRGLTYFVVDMQTAGVQIHPLRQMTGESEFNEVVLRAVRVPDRNRIGAVGQGWAIATSTLMNERVAMGSVPSPRGSGLIAEAIGSFDPSAQQHPVRLDRLMRSWCGSEVHRLNSMRSRAHREAGVPGPESAVTKLLYSKVNMAAHDVMLESLGAEGLLYGAYEGDATQRSLAAAGVSASGFERATDEDAAAAGLAPFPRRYLRSRANSIEAGTSEIMRNVLGERVLGLPAGVRVDRDVPWRDVPRTSQ